MFKRLFGRSKRPVEAVLTEPDLSLARSGPDLEIKSRAAQELWGFGNANRWDADLAEGTISFLFDDKTVTAPVQVIGTYDSQRGSWLWGWDHPSVSHALGHDARRVQAFGETYGLQRLTTRTIACSEEDAWEFTALACYLGKSNGAYRAPSGTTFVFMTFGTVTIEPLHAA